MPRVRIRAAQLEIRGATDREMLEAFRLGVGAFVRGYARHHRAKGLAPGPAAAAALREMAHRAIGDFFGLELGQVVRPERRRPPRRRRPIASSAPRTSDRDARLKAFLDGTGPDPGPERA